MPKVTELVILELEFSLSPDKTEDHQETGRGESGVGDWRSGTSGLKWKRGVPGTREARGNFLIVSFCSPFCVVLGESRSTLSA